MYDKGDLTKYQYIKYVPNNIAPQKMKTDFEAEEQLANEQQAMQQQMMAQQAMEQPQMMQQPPIVPM